jgi:hypothetical protein
VMLDAEGNGLRQGVADNLAPMMGNWGLGRSSQWAGDLLMAQRSVDWRELLAVGQLACTAMPCMKLPIAWSRTLVLRSFSEKRKVELVGAGFPGHAVQLSLRGCFCRHRAQGKI